MTAGSGFDSGARFAAGRGRRSLADLTVPAVGSYSLQLWLRAEAGNEAPGSAVTVPLRFDDLSPQLAFAGENAEGQVKAMVSDAHSGPASGQILYRRIDAERWIELPTKLATTDPGAAELVAPMPELGFGTFVFRAEAADAAGNTAATALRADGTQMAIRRVPPPRVARGKIAGARVTGEIKERRGRATAAGAQQIGEIILVAIGGMHGAKAGGARRLGGVAADRECLGRDERRAPWMLRHRAGGVRARHHHRAPRLGGQIEIEKLDAEERRNDDVVAARAQCRGGARGVGLGAGHQQPHEVTRWPATRGT